MPPIVLLPKEVAPPTRVAVTGASGYVAGPIIRRLLAGGHTVHATVRDPSKTNMVTHLTSLPGAADRLKFFAADLTKEGSFDEAVKGCTHVIHVASPFVGSLRGKEAQEKVITPAIQGTENVLSSVNKTPSVSRVVLTSSMASVVADMKEHGDGAVFNENTWSINCSPDVLPYYYSKREAEKKAWEMAKAQDRWTLCTVNPGLVVGPPMGTRPDGDSITLLAGVLNGGFWPAVPAFSLAISPVEDIAKAHTLAAFVPDANGRYLVAQVWWIKDWVLTLLPKFSKHRLPTLTAPLFLIQLIGPIIGLKSDQIQSNYTRVLPRVDMGKAERELGLQLSSVAEATNDMAVRVIEIGLAKRL